MAVRFTELIVDAADPPALARWWAAVLGWKVTAEEDDGALEIADPGGALPTILFVPVPEPKTVKNRLHIDVSPVERGGPTEREAQGPSGPTEREAQREELERLLSLGARPIDVGQGDDMTWIVLADPEGNELCLLRRPVPGS